MIREHLLVLNEIQERYKKIAKDYRNNRRMPIEDDTIKIEELVIRTERGDISLFDDEIDVVAVKEMVNRRAEKWEQEEKKFRELLGGIEVQFPEGFDINEFLK